MKTKLFDKETELVEWILRTESGLSIDNKDHKGNPLKNLANKRIYNSRRFIDEFKRNFPNDIHPTEFDLIYTREVWYEQGFQEFTCQGFTGISVVEVKYFRKELDKNKNWRINRRYNEGIEQCLSNINLGFDTVELWHFFDPNISEEDMNRYSRNAQIDINRIQPSIIYMIYRLKDGEKNKNFDERNLKEVSVLDSDFNEKKQFIKNYIDIERRSR